MKKVFNATLLATAVAMSFGANAALVTSTPTNLSVEGLAVGNTSTADIIFDTSVNTDHPSGSEIVLTFSAGVDFATNTVAGGACIQSVTGGTATCGDVQFDYGTGSFTFDNVVVDDVANTITFEVNLGNQLSAGSAFRTTVGVANDPILSSASTLDYASNLAGAPIETGTGVIATETAQYAATVTSELDGVIERKVRTTFIENADNTVAQVDVFTIGFTDNAATVVADAFTNGTTVVINHGLTDTTAQVAGFWVSTTVGAATAVDLVAGTVTFDYSEAEWVTAATAGFDTITFTKPAANAGLLEASSFNVDVDVVTNAATAGAGVAGAKALQNGQAAGKWQLDAAVVNVPYLPVGYGLTPNVEIANDSAATVMSEIIIEGFDNAGNVLGPVTLPMTANGKTVTKVSEADIMTAFGITKGKLSVTFIIDADSDKVTLAPYYRQNESRVNVITDQYKADAIR